MRCPIPEIRNGTTHAAGILLHGYPGKHELTALRPLTGIGPWANHLRQQPPCQAPKRSISLTSSATLETSSFSITRAR